MVRSNLLGNVGDRLRKARDQLLGELVWVGNDGALDPHIREAVQSCGDAGLGRCFGPKPDARSVGSDFRDGHKSQIFDEVGQKIEVGK